MTNPTEKNTAEDLKQDSKAPTDSEIAKRPKVLVVDDDPDYLAILKMCLSLNYEVVATSSAFQALEIYDPSFESVVIDYVLAEMDGVELADLLDAKLSRPLILISSHGSKSLKIEDVSKFFAILTKPVEPRELILKVHQSIHQYKSQSREQITTETIINNTLEGIFTFNRDGKIQNWNRRAEEITGYLFGEVYQRDLSFLFASEEGGQIAIKTLEMEDLYAKEMTLLDSKDRKIPCFLSLKPLVILGEKELYLGSFLDLTSLKRAQKALSKATSRFLALSEFHGHLLKKMLPISMLVFDENKKILSWDPEFMDSFGIKKDQRVEAQEMFSPEILEKLNEALDGKSVIYEGKINSDSTGWHRLTFNPMKNNNEEIVGVVVAHEDITAFQEIRKKMLHREKMGALGTIVGGVAHEYNNLLTSIQGAAELILQEDSEKSKQAQRILQAVQRATNLTNQLSEVVQIQDFCPEEVDLKSYLEEWAQEARKQVEALGGTFELDCEGNLPGVFIDKKLFKKGLSILLENSCHALLKVETKKIFLGVKEENHEILISLKDTGQGISPDHLPRVFEPFFTTKGALVGGEIGGRGLGLAIGDNIFRQHGGSIQVFSEESRGSEFIIHLPLSK